MKRNVLKLLFLSFSIILFFTACEKNDDEYPVESYLYSRFSCRSDNSGFFDASPALYTLSSLANINTTEEDVYDIQIYDTWIELHADFYRGDIIDYLTINVNGVGSFVCPAYRLPGDRDNIIIDESIAPGYNRFMADVMRKFLQTGNITIYTSGYINAYNVNIDVYVKSDLDVFVRRY